MATDINELLKERQNDIEKALCSVLNIRLKVENYFLSIKQEDNSQFLAFIDETDNMLKNFVEVMNEAENLKAIAASFGGNVEEVIKLR